VGERNGTISIATYNILNFPGGSVSERIQYFQLILDMLDPDILVVQEMLSQEGADIFLEQILNDDSVEYSAAPFLDGPDTDNLIFYKNSKISYISTEQIPTDLRDISAYTMSLVDRPDVEFIIYSVHLKASQGSVNENRRLEEVLALKEHADNLPEGYHYIVLGDFNIYTSSEPAYQTLMDSFVIDLYDPIDMAGDWHDNPFFADIHTQSTRDSGFFGGASGGMDDRFDMILLSEPFSNPQGLMYIENSYYAFGNDGYHFNQAINYGVNYAVPPEIADALYYASDHVPVIAQFQYLIVEYVRGDVNADGNVNVTDAVYMLTNLFPVPNFPCMKAADCNLDSTLNILDVSYLLDHLFPQLNLPPPDTCGNNPADVLSCDLYPPCGGSSTSEFISVKRRVGDVKLVLGEKESKEKYLVLPLYVETDIDVAAFQFKLSYDGNYEIWVSSEGCVTENYDYFNSFVGDNKVMIASVVSLTPSTTGKSAGCMKPGRYKVAEIRVKGNEFPQFKPLEEIFSDPYGYTIVPITISDIKETELPQFFSLSQNIPNPFKIETEIAYSLPRDVKVELQVFNALGQRVRSLVSGIEKAGYKIVRWDGTDDTGRKLSSGVYFYQLKAGKYLSIKKLLLLR